MTPDPWLSSIEVSHGLVSSFPRTASGGSLSNVAATAAGDVWAVGGAGVSNLNNKTLIEHWDGTAWTQVPSPDQPNAYLNNLFSVVATSSCNARAVGTTAYEFTLIAHWNGAAWK